MSSLETGRTHEKRQIGGCRYRARIKPRQACSCRRAGMPRHRNEAGGIYDDEPVMGLPEAESRHQA